MNMTPSIVIGCGLCVLGLCLRFVPGMSLITSDRELNRWMCFAFLGRRFTFKLKTHQKGINALSLVTDGPYAWVRHPSYSGLILVFIGLVLDRGSNALTRAKCQPCQIFIGIPQPLFGTGNSLQVKLVRPFVITVATALTHSPGRVFWVLALFQPFSICIFLPSRIQNEEAMLEREFGVKWGQYTRQTPRLLVPGIF